MKILVTGVAGFIGYHTALRLLSLGHKVYGIDNINTYYDTKLKWDRLGILQMNTDFSFREIDICDAKKLSRYVVENEFDRIIHLAAQAGVRYSLENPTAYYQSNIIGFGNILEASRLLFSMKHLIYASSSSVYGLNTEMPFCESHNTDRPASIYAATKKANELMAHSYCHNYKMKTTGLRFFTVYGPWGRPDMALFKFTEKIQKGDFIKVYNNGDMKRDFTYIDDIVGGVVKVVEQPVKDFAGSDHKVYNIGNNQPVQLMDFIKSIEKALNKKAYIQYEPMQQGDVVNTYADVSSLERDFNYKPNTSIEEGVQKFVDWYKSYYNC